MGEIEQPAAYFFIGLHFVPFVINSVQTFGDDLFGLFWVRDRVENDIEKMRCDAFMQQFKGRAVALSEGFDKGRFVDRRDGLASVHRNKV